MTIAREEIFGPVNVIIGYETRLTPWPSPTARSTVSPARGVSADSGRASGRAAPRTGRVPINGGGIDPRAPYGGLKLSGIGREKGRYGFEEFLVTKSLQF